MKVEVGARIDFFRGKLSDDIKNFNWQDFFDRLPLYSEYMSDHQGPTSTKSVGNAMEQSIGVSFGAAANGAFLPAETKLR